MVKATKTFKIGECAQGGVITAEVNGDVITVIGKEWDTSAGYKKSSNQSNAKEFTRKTFLITGSDTRYMLAQYLNELTTSYHADKIMDWIKSKVTFPSYIFY